ncbi:chromosome replication/partitioning protein [Borreliella burgdorferi]|uniref:PF-49 protein n=7 Tax=Borreliella TaxID=64895 RepID=H7C7Q5_BORBU|nr:MULTISPECIES: chromosome replication/partitioning protein [Borreliella]AAC35448.1 possible plasmid partition protein; GTG probable start codon; orf3 [Borreliella burgdorferi]AAF07509.1 PF-49 protein [Borreliella burgdorferi B31]AAN17867.1 PF-49 protein [Borreliella burgdorferi]AAN17901.1 PF-49 protein [Borreliella burgdorferi N40]ACK75293.1 putative plasmid partition protein [Borreliella burgdorferi ZS7]
MSKLKVKKILLNNRIEDVQEFENEELEYKSYKDQLRRITVDDVENKIKTMKILYKIREKKLYLIDGYKKFEDFLSEFIISRSQAFLYLKIYRKVLEGSISINDIKEKGLKGVYRNILNVEIKEDKSKQNPIKPLRFQLKKQESYNFYKKNAKFTSFMMDEIFENQKDLINKLLKKYKELKG